MTRAAFSYDDAVVRLESRLRPEGDCLEFTGFIRKDGYGSIGFGGRTYLTHRFLCEAKNGPVDEGLFIDHLCRNRKCCNVSHLEAVSFKENVLRGVGPTALNSRKTHCSRGHVFDAANTAAKPTGGRSCRKCDVIRHQKLRLRRKESVA